MSEIRHIWFDLGGTLAIRSAEYKRLHDELRYQTYARVVARDVDEALRAEFEGVYARVGSNSAVYVAMGLDAGYWVRCLDELDLTKAFLPKPGVRETLMELRRLVPISLFTNALPGGMTKTLAAIDVDPGWFTHVIGGDQVLAPKPALEGFRLMAERSGCAAQSLLYVGDRDEADIKPAADVGMQTAMVWGQSDVADYSCADFADLLHLPISVRPFSFRTLEVKLP